MAHPPTVEHCGLEDDVVPATHSFDRLGCPHLVLGPLAFADIEVRDPAGLVFEGLEVPPLVLLATVPQELDLGIVLAIGLGDQPSDSRTVKLGEMAALEEPNKVRC
jgi:hypothetical protein